MQIDDLTTWLRSRKITFKINTQYHVAIHLPDGSVMDYYPTKSSCMIRGVDDKSVYISDDELIKTVLMGNTPVVVNNSPKIKDTLSLKFKKLHPNAQPPHKTYVTDGGIDLFTVGDTNWEEGDGYFFTIIRTGIALEIPVGYMLMPAPRSSVLFGKHQSPQVSIIDSGYLGEITFLMFTPSNIKPEPIKKGERAAQVVYIKIPIVECDFEEVQNLPTHHSPRGHSGFGSTNTDVGSSIPDDDDCPFFP